MAENFSDKGIVTVKHTFIIDPDLVMATINVLFHRDDPKPPAIDYTSITREVSNNAE